MSNSKNRILIGVIAGMIVVVIVLCILIANSGKNNEDENTENPTAVVTSTIIENDPGQTDNNSEEKATPKPTESPATPTENDTEPESKTEVKVELGEYKGIKAVYSPKEITDEDVTEKLEELQKENSYYVNLPDREFKEGDMIIVTINAFTGGWYIKDLSTNYLQVILGTENLPDFMEKEIIGKKIGDYVDLEYTLPEDYSVYPELAGKTIQYNLELLDGFEFYIPEINDSFIQNLTGYASVEEFKINTKEILQEEEEQRAHDEMLESIRQNLIENCTYTGDIDYEIKKAYALKIQESNTMAEEYGYSDGATYYAWTQGMSSEEYQSMLKEEAIFEVQYSLALDEIVTVEKLAESNPDLSKKELREVAEQLVIDSAVING